MTSPILRYFSILFHVEAGVNPSEELLSLDRDDIEVLSRSLIPARRMYTKPSHQVFAVGTACVPLSQELVDVGLDVSRILVQLSRGMTRRALRVLQAPTAAPTDGDPGRVEEATGRRLIQRECVLYDM
jgi:hypothetical protein